MKRCFMFSEASSELVVTVTSSKQDWYLLVFISISSAQRSLWFSSVCTARTFRCKGERIPKPVSSNGVVEPDRGNTALHEILLKLQPPLSYRMSSQKRWALYYCLCVLNQKVTSELANTVWNILAETYLSLKIDCATNSTAPLTGGPKKQSGPTVFLKESKNVLDIPQCVQEY